MEENEVYLGGFYSYWQLALQPPEHAIQRLGKHTLGAGIYATNKRLFLFRQIDMDRTLNRIVGRKDFALSDLTTEKHQAIIRELSAESPNQISFRKDQISAFELKEPPGIFRIGHLNILLTSGETVKMIIGKKKEYEYILYLLTAFNAQIVKKAD